MFICHNPKQTETEQKSEMVVHQEHPESNIFFDTNTA